ncbi:cell cycle control protein tyrosine phosphatase Mih1, putative [Talaromyces stipitatus ATCC 10500]|uniref:M-phase inducer phosphatase n=1 Tax=Talaromyces stipitatus (strain ATCC 10500 / CBS 375.48 / QM 6759 / NRRL 1006) TaxID=441959 RepID=B8LZI5_TALSN|nr:cell cycle control protein tyrosine phosphatase Mih1, putative [Talaromyces stipitatus ATCC 10500]EED22067.1 cell cycle control protein tyrosine phosphatase Mih1, putative [Talaromyces stipitatus ATCC 10500]
MEHSSPLAAMQPPSVMFGHCFANEGSKFRSLGGIGGFGPSSFNFKDLSMKKAPTSDYFNVKQFTGPSPAASLAADLSQNFHIDQSPQLATPRRSLFSANIFGGNGGRDEMMTTPPLPESSPMTDIMETSPLPHKLPYNLPTTDLVLQSPTPDSESTVSTSTGVSLQASPMEDDQPAVPQERRRPPLLRPSFLRTKAYSTQTAVKKVSPESQCPPFQFGNGSSGLSNSMSLADMFNESSPPQERVAGKGSSANLLGPRLRQPLYGRNSGSASPVPSAVRKNASGNPFMRPRKQCRRSLSMFEHPEDIVRQKQPNVVPEPTLASIMDEEPAHTLQLPHFVPADQPDSLPRIEKGVLVDILDGKYSDRYDNLMIIDCRFEYEYEGGHITGAVNFNDKEVLAGRLFEDPKPGTTLIFHCEYSAHRAPIMASFIRHKDRAYNIERYPNLTFPEMYILDGGYSAFFAQHRDLCHPQNYVEMTSKEHEFACERGLGRVKQRSKFIRAQTFAFGQQSPQMEDSPTGRCRSSNNDRVRGLDSPFEAPDAGRMPGRRMLSY